ncbi:hypothetical protein WA026_019064 [Henosepilachna vigintioctopunctata]|uniref:Uncharacterized protein n=1 Tax=Henosepilachna vigintioctopunctata TaxID=420089 RepID=A0AAW1VHI9_9CUCU
MGQKRIYPNGMFCVGTQVDLEIDFTSKDVPESSNLSICKSISTVNGEDDGPESYGEDFDGSGGEKRRKIHGEGSDEDEEGNEDQERNDIAIDLFSGDDDEKRPERSHGPAPKPHQMGDEEEKGEYSDTDDFIVDDVGHPFTEKKRTKKNCSSRGSENVWS